jgi:hypothetical protein
VKTITRIGLCALLGAAGLAISPGSAQAGKYCREGNKRLTPNTMRCRPDGYYRCTKEGTWKKVGKCKYRAPKKTKRGSTKFCAGENGRRLAPNTMRCRSDNTRYRCMKDGNWKRVGKCKYRPPRKKSGSTKYCREGNRRLLPNTMRCRRDGYYRCMKDGRWKKVGKCKYRGK